MALHVLHLIHNLKREGAQSMVVNLATAVDRNCLAVTVYPWRETGPYAAELTRQNIEVVTSSKSKLASRWVSAWRLLRFIKQNDVDLVHAHMSDSAILAAFLSLVSPVRIVITHHSNRLLPDERKLKHYVRRALARWACGRAAFNVAVTEAVATQLTEGLGIPVGRVRVVANGVPLPDQRRVDVAREERDARRSRGDYPRIVALGRLAPVKRQDIAIAALSEIRTHQPRATLSIAGGGPLMEELADLAVRKGVQSSVRLIGATDDVASVLQDADIFVATSSYEGLPVSVLEAMSWELPVIATDVPGHRDVISSGENGYLVPFEDPGALSRQVVGLTALDAKSIGVKARALVAASYSANTMAETYTALYRAALEPTFDETVAARPVVPAQAE